VVFQGRLHPSQSPDFKALQQHRLSPAPYEFGTLREEPLTQRLADHPLLLPTQVVCGLPLRAICTASLASTIADVSEFVCVTALASEEAISVSEFGNINPIPFRIIFTVSLSMTVTFETDFSDSLGPTDQC